MKLSQDGQVTIPKQLRDLLGLQPGADLAVELTKEGILFVPQETHREGLARWLREEHGDELATLNAHEIMQLLK